MQSDLESMSLHDLCDLLVVKTTEFMKQLEQRNANGFKIRDLKLEVEKIQEHIKARKTNRVNA